MFTAVHKLLTRAKLQMIRVPLTETEMQSSSEFRLSLAALNPHIICILCRGYMVDATSIIECLHSFCRTCIYRYLETNKYCPICEVQVHKTKPLLNVRPDKTLQSLVYKLVPGLYKDEMRRRRVFYQQRSLSEEELNALTGSPDEKALYTSEFSAALNEDELISLCLELSDRLPPVTHVDGFTRTVFRDMKSDLRYLLCPSGLTVGHLKRFIQLKLDLPSNLNIDVFHSDEALKEFYTLRDIANIYTWRQTSPLHLYYVLYSLCCQSESSAAIYNNMTTSAGFNGLRLMEKDAARRVKRVCRSENVDCAQPFRLLKQGVVRETTDSTTKCEENAVVTLSDRAGVNNAINDKRCLEQSGLDVKESCQLSVHVDKFEGLLSDETNSCRRLGSTRKPNSTAADNCKKRTSYGPSDSEMSGVHDKVGFEAEAVSSSAAATRWTVERRCPLKVRRVHGEVRRLFIDENTPGAKRELRSFRRRVADARRKHRSPLTSRPVIRVASSSSRLSRLLSCKRSSQLNKQM